MKNEVIKMKYHVLIVEDQMEIVKIITKYLEKENYTYQIANNGIEALDLIANEKHHLIILDIMLPGINGFEILKSVRSHSDIPVIMLTAMESEIDRLKGFDLGADDYVIKPFSPRELMKRINAMIKRCYHPAQNDGVLEVGELKLNTINMTLLKNNIEIPITATEMKLLQIFMTHVGHVMTREQLLNLSFGIDYEGYDRNIDSYIKRLRHKIEDDSKNPKYLRTKYGAGYIFGGDTI